MAARSKARKRALDILFEAEQRGLDAADPARRPARRRRPAGPPLNPSTPSSSSRASSTTGRDIDELLSSYARAGPSTGCPPSTATILRLGAWEILWNDARPRRRRRLRGGELATELSTDDSPGFVNGLLGRLVEVKPTLA